MSKRKKRLSKLRQNPKNVSFEDLQKVLEDNDFVLDHATGSHHIFRLKINDLVFRVVIPFARPVKSRYVIEALKAIDQANEAQSELTDIEEDESHENDE